MATSISFKNPNRIKFINIDEHAHLLQVITTSRDYHVII